MEPENKSLVSQIHCVFFSLFAAAAATSQPNPLLFKFCPLSLNQLQIA